MDPRDPAGVLIIRVWIERAADSGFRARIIASKDLTAEESTTVVAGSVGEVVGIVHAWLERFLEAETEPAAT